MGYIYGEWTRKTVYILWEPFSVLAVSIVLSSTVFTRLLQFAINTFYFQCVGTNFVFLLNCGEHCLWCRRPFLGDGWAGRESGWCSQCSCFHPTFPSRVQHSGRRKGCSPLRYLFVTPLPQTLSKHFLSQCYFLIRLLSLEFLKLTFFLFSHLFCMWTTPQFLSLSTPEMFPDSHWCPTG